MTTMPFAQNRRSFTVMLGFAAVLMLMLFFRTSHASAATCTAPTTDYGTVTSPATQSLPAGTYKIWTRMVAADTTNNTYLLQVDSGASATCYTVGGSTVQTYTTAQDTANTRFSTSASNTSDWIAASTTVTFSTAGTHTLTMIGNAPNVVIDRIILTQDTSCVPAGLGDNCANPPDTTAPVVSITSPTTGASVSSPVAVAVSATDDSGVVSKVDLYVDGSTTPYATDTSSPFSFNVTGLSVGSHTLVAKATDPSSNAASSTTVTVTVKDTTAPTGVAITAPAAGTTQSGTITLTASAADNVGVSKVDFYVDGGTTPIGTDTTSAYSITYSTTGLSNGSHTFTAKASDAAGNSTTSAGVPLTISNGGTGTDTTPPTVVVTAPLANAIISTDLNNTHFNSSAVTLGATAADASGIKKIDFYVDNTLVKTVTATPFTFAYNTTALACGTHTFKATATDNSTNANTASASTTFKTAKAADINGDCSVTFLDLSAIAPYYGKTGTTFGRADANQDGIVNFLDLSVIAPYYGK